MVDTIRTEAALQALFPDNADRLVSARDLRDFLVSTTIDINSLRNVPVRYASLFPGANLGVKINTAIADLPADGGKVMLPYGYTGFSTPIDIANRSNIWLCGYGMPTRHTNHLSGVFVGTELHYTGTGSAILLGPTSGGSDSNRCTDCRLEGFNLRFDATADYGVHARAWATSGYLRDFSVRGTGDSGIGFYTPGVNNHAWQFGNFQVRNCAVGADINGFNNYNFYGGCAFNSNAIGVRMGNEVSGAGIAFHNTDALANTDVCYEIINGSAVNFFGGYSELLGANRLVLRVGAGASQPDGVNVYGMYVNASTEANYIFQVNRVAGMTVDGCVFIGSGPAYVINNVATDVLDIDFRPSNRYVNGSINNMTGVIPTVKYTAIGGLAVLLTNHTGISSIAGVLVEADTANNDSVVPNDADGSHPIGVFLDDGVADGEKAWVVISGIADVAMEENTAAIRGYWVRTSETDAGFSNAETANPPLGGVALLDAHMTEVGHCIESVAAGGEGTNIKARCILHFN